MAQSMIGGATDYHEQSINDIREDIIIWIEYTKRIKKLLSDGVEKSKSSKFWNIVDSDFKMTIITSIRFCLTVETDLNVIVKAIDRDAVSLREIKLLKNIGEKSIGYNNEYGLTYKAEKRNWHDYGNPDFEVVENMYAKGRDYFVTLQDALNASYRLEDYMQNGNTTNVNFNGTVSDSQIQIGTVNSNQSNLAHSEVPYDEIMEVICEINKYRDILATELKENNEIFCKSLEKLTVAVESKENSAKIKESIENVKNFLIGMGSSIAASGILSLLSNIKL